MNNNQGMFTKENNIDNWHEFEVGELFNAITKTAKVKDFTRENYKDDVYSIPALSSLALNNSHGFYVKKSEHELIDSPSLSVTSNGVNAGTVFVQTEPFAIVQDAYALIVKDHNASKEVYLFVATTLEKLLIEKYGFNEKAVWSKVKKESLPLPAIYNQEKEECEPDWDYMEDFIKELKETNDEKLKFIKEIKPADDEIDISDWHEFEVGKLFKIRPTKHHNLTNAMLFDPDGKTPVVVNSSFDNGIGGFTTLNTTEKAPKITFSDTTDAEAIFLQTKDFAGYSHIQCLNPIKYEDKWNEKTLMFFQAVFKVKARTMSYNYVNKFTRDSASKLMLPLPAIYNSEKEEYEPDWEYMENFIRERQNIVKEQFRRIKK